MNTKKEPSNNSSANEVKRLLSIVEASVYLGIGRSSAIHFLNDIGAKIKIGNRTLYDKNIIDKYINSNTEVK